MAPETTTGSEPVGTVERLADLLDRYERAQDIVTRAYRAETEVEDEIRDELGITDVFVSQDKLTAGLLRALVKARRAERESS